jgi:hypothetical protein
VLGREVATLVSQELLAGDYPVTWDATGFPSGVSSNGRYASGVYFYQLSARTLDESSRRPSGEAGSFVETKKLVLVR